MQLVDYQKVRQIRIEKEIPLKEIISMLNLETPQAYYKKELGMIRFSLEDAAKISKLFGMQIEEIFLSNGVPETNEEVINEQL